jgi:hypothetical protein
MGPEVNIKQHYSHLCNDWMGIALCAVFCASIHDAITSKYINWTFIVNGNKIRIPAPGVGFTSIASDHILVSYYTTTALRERFSKSLMEYDTNGFCHIGIRFEIYY